MGRGARELLVLRHLDMKLFSGSVRPFHRLPVGPILLPQRVDHRHQPRVVPAVTSESEFSEGQGSREVGSTRSYGAWMVYTLLRGLDGSTRSYGAWMVYTLLQGLDGDLQIPWNILKPSGPPYHFTT